MFAAAHLGLPDGSTTTLGPGDIIGRMPSAALVLDDPRISECHAMLSLRGAELQLLSLRGLFAVNGQPSSKAVLAEGQALEFADGMHLEVLRVDLPERLPAIEGDGLPRHVLSGSNSLYVGPPPRVVPGHSPDAAAWIWASGPRWRLRVVTGPTRELAVDESFEVGTRRFRLCEVPVDRASVDPTVAEGRVGEVLTLTSGWDTFRIDREGRPPFVVGGLSARMLSLLAEVDTALSWESLAHELWATETNRDALRRRLDVALARLRSRLRSGGVRTDLVRASGAGHYELVRYAGDVVIDRS